MNRLPAGALMDETFFAAQRRHRRTARLYSALAALAALLQGIPMSIMLSPVVVGVLVIALDLVNLWHPVPDLGAAVGRVLDTMSSHQDPVTGAQTEAHLPLAALALLTIPGLVSVVLLWAFVRRFLIRDGLGGVLLAAGARPADPTDGEEHQLVNVVEEIALAAGIAPPRVLVLPAEVPNAAAFGRSPENWTIAVSRGLLDDLDRDATQGVIAHLVGSVGNGDLRMQHSLLSLFVSYQLAQDLIAVPFARSCRRRARRVWRMLRGRASPEDEAETIRELLDWDESNNFVVSMNMITFKIVQFYTTLFVVGGFLTLPFRARRYLADATAVQLAGSPDGIGRALVHLDGEGRNLPGAEFAAIYTITAADTRAGDGTVEDAATLPASLHPPLRKRVRKLRRLGFRGDLPAAAKRIAAVQRWPWIVRWPVYVAVWVLVVAILGGLLLCLAVCVFMGIVLSVAIGVLFWGVVTLIPVAPLHLWLRGMG